MTVYYFGCLRRAGHFLYKYPNGIYEDWKVCPWGYSIDGRLLEAVPEKNLPCGRYIVAKKDGWTAISFLDRSVNERYGSNSAFLVPEDITAEAIIEEAKKQWKEVFDRTDFPDLIPYEGRAK